MTARFKSLFPALLASILLLHGRSSGAETNFVIQPPVSTNVVGVTLLLSLFQVQDTNYPALTYQWYKDGAALTDGDQISGSQTDALLIEDTTLEEAGVYSAQVLLNGTLIAEPTSHVHLLDVPLVEGIRQQNVGSGIRLLADATGGLLSYQWMWQGQDIPGATSSALVFGNPYVEASAGYYTVRITNLLGQAVSAAPGFLLTKTAPSGNYEGLFYEADQVAHDASGAFQFTLSGSKRTFSGKLFMGRSRYSFSGKLSMTHEGSTLIKRKDGRPLDLRFQLVTTNNDSRCVGTITDGAWDAGLQGSMVYYSKVNPTPLARNYTLALVNTNASNTEPNGSGCARVTVTSAGKVTFAGHTATGFAMSQTRGLSRNGVFPLYAVVNGGKERVLGWLRVTTQGTSAITGESIVWTKEASSTAPYRNGFYLPLSASGSRWPNGSTATVGFMEGVAAFFGGDLVLNGTMVSDFVRARSKEGLAFNAKETPEKLKFSINRKTGALDGSMLNPLTGKKLKIRGVALPQQTRAMGFFLGTQGSGNFTLSPAPAQP